MIYTKLQILLHWISAILVLTLAFSGLSYTYDLGDWSALSTHQFVGQVFILFLLLRIAVRFSRKPSQPNHTKSDWQTRLAARLAKTVHIALYLCLICFAVTGYVSASALTNTDLLFPVERSFARSDTGDILLEIHYALKWVLLVLLCLHLAGALKQVFWGRTETVSNMIKFKK
jgi:cytochrome b561